jgi:peptidoglycan/LPS O-acetylase OafA/YrhL
MSTGRHLNFLDGVRSVAALVVVFHHAWLQSWPYTMYPVAKPSGILGALTGWLAFGKLAVTAFIVISGFCLMLPVVRFNKAVEPKRFFLRRCRRLLPPYYAALAIAILLDFFLLKARTGTLYDGSLPITLTGLLSHLTLVQNFTSYPFQIAGPFWSIAVEFQIYLFFPFFVLVYKRWGILPTLALTTIFGYIASFAFASVGFDNTFSHFIAMFGFGMAAAHFAFTLQESAWRRAAIICYASVPLLAIVGIGLHHELGSNKLITDALTGLLVAVLLLLMSLKPHSFLARSFSVRPLVFVGSFSYSIYLIHFPLQQLIWQWTADAAGWSRPTSFFFIAGVGTICILILSFGFFQLFERPYLKESADGRSRAALADTNT